MKDFDRLSKEANLAGFRLEIVRGIPTWEAFPVLRHQRTIMQVVNSVRPVAIGDAVCACIAVIDVDIRFSDGSRKCPDISIFCREPDELDSTITLQPEAVIEVISEGYEDKDFLIGVPFYRQIGIPDVVTIDPRTGEVRHWQQNKPEAVYTSPVNLTFLCGCTCTV